MAKSPVKHYLTEFELLKYQRRLSSYLKDFEYTNDLQAKDVAEKLELSPQKFSYLKSSKKPYSKFVNCVDYLAKLGSLRQMSIGEFSKFLEGHQEDVENTKVYSWQKTLIESFEPVTSNCRESFISLCKMSLREGKSKLEVLLQIVSILEKKDIQALVLLRDALQKIT